MNSMVLLCVLALLHIFWPQPAVGKIVDKIVAQVNNDIITLSELEQAMKYQRSLGGSQAAPDNEAYRRQTLDMLIDRKLAKEEAKRYGMTISEKDLRKALDDIKQRNGFADDEALKRALAKDGMTLEQLRQQLTEQMQLDRLMAVLVKEKPKVTEAEIKRFYEANYTTPENRVHVKIIALPVAADATPAQQEEVRAKAEEALNAALQGEDFDKLIQTYSTPGPGMPGGDLGFIRQADLDPKFFEFLVSLKPGEVVPLKTPQGFQIIKMIEAKMNQVVGLEEVRPQIVQILEREQLLRRFSEQMKDARKRALIKIML
ncbi:MAG: SurA N-terminal domain-containing protein [Desulfobacca sp.]|uniref:SurA N-terminal domain-containing protein n=1 Tax=Desulfobacca sp. TaxID=2067990 RepID=UPI004049D51C